MCTCASEFLSWLGGRQNLLGRVLGASVRVVFTIATYFFPEVLNN